MQHAIVRVDTTLSLQEWEAFCAEHEVKRLKAAAGGNVYTRGGKMGIECVFGQGTRGGDIDPPPPSEASDVTFTTVWGGSKVAELAELACAFWARFGGAIVADEGVRRTIAGDGG
jgi:hypothetical protein